MSRTVPVLTSLVLLFCSVVFAQNGSVAIAKNDGKTSALLRTEGKSIKVNGAIVPTTMTIFENDRIQTGADTVAHVIMPGHILTLDRKSTAIFRDGTLVVKRGRAWLAGVGATAGATTTIAAASLGGGSTVVNPAMTGVARAGTLAATTTTTSNDPNHDGDADRDDNFTGTSSFRELAIRPKMPAKRRTIVNACVTMSATTIKTMSVRLSRTPMTLSAVL